MTRNEQLVRVLCLPHCKYYKPGKNEASVCRGAVVIDRLLRAGRRITTAGHAEQCGIPPDASLVNYLCTVCDFHENDCDFMQDQTATPCGGFLLLERLLGSGVITLEEIK